MNDNKNTKQPGFKKGAANVLAIDVMQAMSLTPQDIDKTQGH